MEKKSDELKHFSLFVFSPVPFGAFAFRIIV